MQPCVVFEIENNDVVVSTYIGYNRTLAHHALMVGDDNDGIRV